MNSVGTFNGVPIVIGDKSLDCVPRMTLSEDVPVTDKFRAEMNAWMLEFFGTEARVLKLHNPATLIMGPLTFRKLEAQLLTHRHPT